MAFSETLIEKVRRARCHPKPSHESDFVRHGTNTFARAEDRILRLTVIIVLDSNRSGSDRKPWFKTRLKYSDEPSYRIRQNLHFSSERLRSMLRGIDTVLTG